MTRVLLALVALGLPLIAQAATKSPASKIAAAFSTSHPSYRLVARNVTVIPNSHLIAGPNKISSMLKQARNSGMFSARATKPAPNKIAPTSYDVRGHYKLSGKKATLSSVRIALASKQMAGMPKPR